MSTTNTNLASLIRILLLDQHAMFREGLRRLLEPGAGFLVVGESGETQAGIELAARLKPDIILLELNLDDELDTEVISTLMRTAYPARIILLTGITEQPIWQLAVQMGAMGIVTKSSPISVLCKAIHKVHQGEVWIDRSMMASVLTNLTRSRIGEQTNPQSQRISTLSDREKEVIGLIGAGMKNRDIATRLSISEITVRHHLSSIYSKLDVSDRLELTIYAYRNGLAALPT